MGGWAVQGAALLPSLSQHVLYITTAIGAKQHECV